MIKKIIVVVESIDVDDSSGSKANVALIQNLQKIGCDMTVYHYTLQKVQLKNIPCYLIKEKKGVLYLLSRFQRVFTRITGININPLIEGAIGYSFTFLNDVQSIKRAIKKENINDYDFVLTLSKGASFRPHYAINKLPKWHSKWIAYIHDPYPFHFYPRPYNWIEPGYNNKELFFREVSNNAKFSAFPSKLLKEWMGSYFSQFLKTGVVIPHQLAVIDLHQVDLPKYFDSTMFTLLHAGNLIKQRSPKGLMEGFLLFLKQYPDAKKDAKLLLIGNASYHKGLLEAYSNKYEQIFVKPTNESFDCVYNMQQQVAVNIILESKSEISPFLPGKFPHCVAANKPILVLAPYYSETRRLLGVDYPYISEVDDEVKIAAQLEQLYVLWKQCPTKVHLNRPDLERYLSVSYLEEVISDLK